MATETYTADAGEQPADVFAVGDVRAGSVKRVASAVGEGAISIYIGSSSSRGSLGTATAFMRGTQGNGTGAMRCMSARLLTKN